MGILYKLGNKCPTVLVLPSSVEELVELRFSDFSPCEFSRKMPAEDLGSSA